MKVKISPSVIVLSLMFCVLPLHALDELEAETHQSPFLAKKLDIIFIIDNSPNLFDKQKRLALEIDKFINSLKNIDWHIAVTNSDVSGGAHSLNGHFVKYDNGDRFIRKNTDKAPQKLIKALIRENAKNCDPTCPSESEEPLKSLALALGNSKGNAADFFRPDAELSVVFLTDEDEMSTGPLQATKPGHILNAMESYFTNKLLLPYGFIVQNNDGECRKNQGTNSQYSSHIEYLISNAKGLSFSICSNFYDTSLLKASYHMKKQLHSIVLRHEPDVSSISIENDQNLKWHVRGKKIIFTQLDEQQRHLYITYKKTKYIIKPK